jgi:hypothetical protein
MPRGKRPAPKVSEPIAESVVDVMDAPPSDEFADVIDVVSAGVVEAASTEAVVADRRSQQQVRVDEQLDQLQAALDSFRAEGAGAFDDMSCACVEALIARARQLEPRPAELLGQRAGAHMTRLRERFAAASVVTAQRLEQTEQRVGALPREREALQRGAFASVRRALRRLGAGPQPQAALATVRDERKRRTSEYRSQLASYITTRAVARAVDGVPEQAGPYNPLRIASDLLVRISTFSPIYLSSQLQRLEELASLMGLPEVPQAAPPPPAAKPPSRKKSLPQKGRS